MTAAALKLERAVGAAARDRLASLARQVAELGPALEAARAEAGSARAAAEEARAEAAALRKERVTLAADAAAAASRAEAAEAAAAAAVKRAGACRGDAAVTAAAAKGRADAASAGLERALADAASARATAASALAAAEDSAARAAAAEEAEVAASARAADAAAEAAAARADADTARAAAAEARAARTAAVRELATELVAERAARAAAEARCADLADRLAWGWEASGGPVPSGPVSSPSPPPPPPPRPVVGTGLAGRPSQDEGGASFKPPRTPVLHLLASPSAARPGPASLFGEEGEGGGPKKGRGLGGRWAARLRRGGGAAKTAPSSTTDPAADADSPLGKEVGGQARGKVALEVLSGAATPRSPLPWVCQA